MRSNPLKAALIRSGFAASVLLLASGASFGQQVINLSAGPAGVTLPDGAGVPMWGYSCGAAATGNAAPTATCEPLNPAASVAPLGAVSVINGGSGYTTATVTIAPPASGTTATAVATIANGQVASITLTNAGTGYTSAPQVTITGDGSGAAATAAPLWSPVVITVPSGAAGGLQINFTNNLSFAGGANNIPTSLVVVGQVGGGLGTVGAGCTEGTTCTPPPDHSMAQANVTWPIANTGPAATPPTQGNRVQSFATEVAPGATAATVLTWSTLRPGTYLLESGTHPSIQVPMGLYGILVVTSAPTASSATGTAYPKMGTAPAVTYNAEVPLEFSEVDPVLNNNVNIAVNTPGFSETMVWSGQQGGCGNPASSTYHQCYPPAVNYTPLYYLINGVAFDKTHPTDSLFAVTQGGAAPPVSATGTVLVRMVNAGLRMHVPSIVGAQTQGFSGAGVPNTPVGGFTLIAEDGNPVPGPLTSTGGTVLPAPRVQTDVFMAAGKTFDVMINVPTCTGAGCTPAVLPVYDRELSLSANSSVRDGGMLAYLGVNGATLPSGAGGGAFSSAATANPDTYNALVGGQTLTVSDVSKGVMANDINVYGVTLATAPSNGTVTLNTDGTFTYVPNGTATTDSFGYCANGAAPGTPKLCATVTLGASTLATSDTITCTGYSQPASTATLLAVRTPGLLGNCTDQAGLPLTINQALLKTPPVMTGPGGACASCSLTLDANGGFTANVPAPGVYTFSFTAQNSQGTLSGAATATLTFPAPSNLSVTVLDPKCAASNPGHAGMNPDPCVLNDYRWVIEEDKTFYVDPKCTATSATAQPGCPTWTVTQGVPPTFGVNFHTSHMEYVAQGCTGVNPTDLSCEQGQTVLGTAAACDVGNGQCTTTRTQQLAVLPGSVSLDPGCGFGSPTKACANGAVAPYPKRYYISVLPGDAANPFQTGNLTASCANGAPPGPGANCGHTMGGAPISWNSATNSWNPVTVLVEPAPLPPGKLSVMVFEDDFPLNGEQDAGGGIDVIATNEPGLGGFNIVLWDDMGQSGDVTGQMTYDMFNQPLTNSLAGTIDPSTGLDACPISKYPLMGGPTSLGGPQVTDPTATGITGTIVTCPTYESDGVTKSPLAGQAVVANLMPGRFSVQAYPGADRIARGEQWLQTNTLDGQHAHDSFIRIGEPTYFQEYGPAGYHVSIGFANPAIINGRHAAVCSRNGDGNVTATNCSNTVKGVVTTERMSRIPDERLYGSGNRDQFAWTQCYVSLGDPDGEDFMFTACDAKGNFTFTGVPEGAWRLSIFDQWNDQLMDGLTTPVNVCRGATGNAGSNGCNTNTTNFTVNMGEIPVQQWQANVYTRTFVDDSLDGVYQQGELGIPFLNTTVRYRDGSLANNLLTDFNGVANFNETFPLFSWYVVEADTTRYKTTGIHTVYDAGGPADGTTSCGNGTNGFPSCGGSTIGRNMANTYDPYPLPANLSVPGAVYCTTADCTGQSIQNGPVASSTSNHSTGRIDAPWVAVEGWQGFSGQSNFIEFGKAPYAPNENGGIHGHVIYASTRPFDDPQMLVQTQWEPLVPRVTINLYQEGVAADGVTPTLTLVDTTKTSSFDDWAQGFHAYSDAVTQIPNMNCPGQGTASGGANPDLFFYSLYNQPTYLNLYDYYYNNITAAAPTPLPYNSQYKCYDGMHNWNQLQPAPYDGMYAFPSVTGMDPITGKPTGTNCKICLTDPDASDKFRYGGSPTPMPWTPARGGVPMLPPGKYVVEVVVPPGYELVKEEDKNILIGDNFIAPVTVQFPGLAGNVFIIPDQASVASSYDPSGTGYNAYNAQNPTQSFGASPNNQIVPGFLEPVWPCVGELRTVPDFISLFPQSAEVSPFAGASRHLCDRKEVTLGNQMAATAKFYIFTSTHIASKFTGGITDDFTSEFDPFAPVFGEKFAPPNMPVAVRDWSGAEIARVYSDQWGQFNGMTYSTWEVNPPNPTGYSPTMMVFCMNDKGPIPGPNGTQITDPLFNPLYSQFCYELPYMPGTTSYLDTPVVPTAAFVGAGYNNPDCAYPALTPAIASVTSSDVAGPWAKSAPGASVTSLTLTRGGSGYTGLPTISITSPDGSGGGATAVVSSLDVSAVAVTAAGSNYTGAPAVGFTGGGGTGAAGTATMKVTTVTVTNSGEGYTTTSPGTNILAGGGGTGARADITDLKVVNIRVTNGGSGYASAPTVTIAAPLFGTRAVAVAHLTGGAVTSITVTNPGSGYGALLGLGSVPAVTFTGGGGTGAAATALMGVNTVTLIADGSGYTGQPTVTFPTPGSTACNTSFPCTRAAGSAFLGVNAVNVTAPGSGYTSVPSVTFTGGAGSGAAAAASMAVGAVSLTADGSGYDTAPTVTFTDPSGVSGSGAQATAVLGPFTGGSTLTITALGDQTVINYGYSGPSASAAPFNQKTVSRHYGFGATQGSVVLKDAAGVSHPLTNVSWSDGTITGGIPSGVGLCPVQQQAQYQGSPARCGELVITAATGQQSIDTVTVTIGGKQPTVLNPQQGDTIQAAIDKAAPGDLIIVPAGTFRELVIMWKPVRLQGVGAASSIIDASTQPAGQTKMDNWRREVNCLFGLSLNGQALTGGNAYDSTGTYNCPSPTSPTATGTGPNGNTWNYFYGGPNYPQMVVDRVPLEGILGWDASVNGNLAEQLQEPSLMGAYEGAGITVVAKGVNIPANSTDVYGSGAEAAFPTGSTLLTGDVNMDGSYATGDANPICRSGTSGTNQFPTNFTCNPSSIDGLGVTDSSQGGGGIFLHAWAHNMQIANNRVFNNAGTLSGGIVIGQGESPEAYLNGTANDTDPGTCLSAGVQSGLALNTQLPYCENIRVNIHNNSVTNNASLGDELFSGTPAGAGGVSICTGADYYQFNYNWVCGNLSTGDGGGVGHIGFSWNGDIEHNQILFNQSTNPSIQSNGGGLIVMGAPPDANAATLNGAECGSVTDVDCAPGLSDGTGPGLVINANLFQGNSADAGSGGAIRLQAVNGTDIPRFTNPYATGSSDCSTQYTSSGAFNCLWYVVSVTNNVIVNNLAGWDGAGVSLEDSLAVKLINNTIASNDTTASSGVLFNTIGAPDASSQSAAPGCALTPENGGTASITASCPQPAGLVSLPNSPQLTSSLTTGAITCPAGHYVNGTGTSNGTCTKVSYPAMYNNIFWQNRSFDISVGGKGSTTQNQQNTVTLFNANFGVGTATAAGTQQATGSCTSYSTAGTPVQPSYWDIGVRGDTSPTAHGSGFTLQPLYGVLTSTTGYSSTNSSGNPAFVTQYCNGSRIPPEFQKTGWQVPPGIADAVVPNPVFSLTPNATVDEGNNWINISWGPLSLVNPVTSTSTTNVYLGNYSLQSSSSAINAITCTSTTGGVCTESIGTGTGISGVRSIKAPATDFFGNTRPDTGNKIDAGAIEVSGH